MSTHARGPCAARPPAGPGRPDGTCEATDTREAAGEAKRLPAGAAGPALRRRLSQTATAVVLFLVVYGCGQLYHWGPPGTRQLFADLSFFPIDGAAVWACWRASRRVADWPGFRRAWLLIAASLLAWTAGDVTYAIYDLIGISPYPSPADAFYLAFYPVMLAGILSFPSARRRRGERVRLWLDLATVTLGGSGVVIYLVLGPTAIGDNGSPWQTAFSVAYPVGDMVLLVALASALLRTSTPSARGPLGLLAGALALFVVADLIYGYLSLHNRYQSGDLVDTIWVLAVAFFTLAGAAQPRVDASEQVDASPRRVVWPQYAAVAFGFGVLLYADRHGRFYPVFLLMLVAAGVAALIAVRQFLSQRDLLAAQRELSHQALHDGLTGLANRTLLHDRLAHALFRSRRNRTDVAVMLLDVDDFKLVNDSLGHDAGDDLLVELARRLSSVLRSGETIARLGGDEFAFVAEGRFGEHELVALAERILSVFARPFVVGEGTRDVSGSLGIAVGHASDAGAPADVLRDADTAMYRAKTRGKGRYDIFDPGLRKDLLHHIELRAALAKSLDDGELEVCFQPIVTTAERHPLALEALVRWRHPRFGSIETGEFIALAEDSGLIARIDGYVLDESARNLARIRKRFPTALPLGVFVNISPRELAQPGFPAVAAAILARHGLEPTDVAFELTERVFIADHVRMLDNLRALTEHGIRFVLDDFGTGYSALASLQRFPLAAIKIDRYFVDAIHGLDDEAPIVRAIVGLGHSLGLMVIAEGVETHAQLDHLRRLRCDAVQGFLVGRPLGADATDAYLAAQRSRRARRAAPPAEPGSRPKAKPLPGPHVR